MEWNEAKGWEWKSEQVDMGEEGTGMGRGNMEVVRRVGASGPDKEGKGKEIKEIR